jgi:Rha family phage regulatory protein
MRTAECPLTLPRADQLVTLDGDHLVTDSRIVAKVFGKLHRDVLKAYDKLACTPEFSQRNFAPAEFLDAQRKRRRCVRMTKDGFTMLAMGFTGARAMQFKEAYINAFNAMAEQLAAGERNLWQKMQALIAKETASQVRAAFGSRLMNVRRREIRPLRKEREELETALQPSLLN